MENVELHTCYHPSAILIYSYPRRLALEDVIPTKSESEEWKYRNKFRHHVVVSAGALGKACLFMLHYIMQRFDCKTLVTCALQQS